MWLSNKIELINLFYFFIRNDIDVHQVRIARNKIICLRNDLKDVMAKIESGLHNLHQQSRDGLGPEVNMPEVLAQATGKVYLGPSATFVRVDLVTEGSPAERAGFIVVIICPEKIFQNIMPYVIRML